jgi:hypothetical protein
VPVAAQCGSALYARQTAQLQPRKRGVQDMSNDTGSTEVIAVQQHHSDPCAISTSLTQHMFTHCYDR